ncbi:MAG: GNAT family N-acetyltransferase [Bacteroidaceae bacterium]|nr:GNAT family N-acetyltransferase [Bacteroidaceae bacterium]
MNRNEITALPYTPDRLEEWNRFVADSRNGTFLHLREYMDYHSDRFTDNSLLFYRNGELTAILPANIKEETVVSHGGLTYGGLLLGDNATADCVLDIFSSLMEYLETKGIKSLIYRPVPHIYHRYPCEEDLYALFRNNAQLTERKISTTIKLCDPLPFKGRRKLTASTKSRLHIVEDNNFTAFWEVLDSRLKDKYGVAPVHSLQEIELLHNRFPNNILLFRVTDGSSVTLGGVVMYVAGTVIHTQYTGTTDEGRRIGVLDHLYNYLINERFKQYDYLDFGVSVEQGGHYLNSGLIAQKEGLGGRAVMYDTYVIEIRKQQDGE